MTLLKMIAVSLLLSIAACGGNKVITTTDDSAEYQSARQLPPLSKNPVAGSANSTGQAIDLSSSEIPPSVSETNQIIATSVVEGNNNSMRVRIDAGMNAAWPYFLNKLRTAGVTIHSRNNVANRVEVGCGAMDDGTGTSSKSSGWSIFNRSSVIYEYCVMELISNRDSTLVSVLNRHGDEVRGSEAMKLLDKIVSK